ncbi:C39 family peptidase [Bacillus norwichensis]|uniref:C39 family peptidase n=1 Tax=Bacillus norwichensis TaxID=2762217 RepID=A0ABR8VMP8_9BACI|nr:C39 family peptidase [Bacillus norwichensis]MBD8006045.1 C39 family peptidase [Bacillus norwichensis]
MNAWPIFLVLIIGFMLILLSGNRSSYKAFFSFFIAACTFTIVLFNTMDNSEQQKATASQEMQQNDDIQLIKIKDKVLLDFPVIEQLPELPRGCEVTSLAMLLESAGTSTDKMTLAKEIKRDPSPYVIKNGKVYFGNPHKGFVGNMYDFNKPGLGVYHEPIMELGEKYLPGRIVNLTGEAFEELKIPLSDGRPVWVIINAEYRELPDSYFETWETDSGPVKITKKEHSVLITGYDQKYIYFNDPLTGKKNKKAPIGDFEKSWVQMGSQALTYKVE